MVTRDKRFRAQVARSFNSVSVSILNRYRNRYVGRLEQFTYFVCHIGDDQDKSLVKSSTDSLVALKNWESVGYQTARAAPSVYRPQLLPKTCTHQVMRVQSGDISPVALRRFREKNLKVGIQNER